MRVQLNEFGKFCLVGGVCTGIDAGIFYLLYLHTGYRIAMISGFALSLGVNYLLNTYWSFQQKPSLKTAIGVLTAHFFNIFVVRMALMWIFINISSLGEGVAFVPTLIISVMVNFLIIKFVYKSCSLKHG